MKKLVLNALYFGLPLAALLVSDHYFGFWGSSLTGVVILAVLFGRILWWDNRPIFWKRQFAASLRRAGRPSDI